MSAMPIAPWKAIAGSGQSVSLTADTAASFTHKLGAQTWAVQLSVTGAACLVRISAAGTAATATSDVLLKDTDPPLVLACRPGDTVSAYGLGAGTAYLTELTH